MKKVNEAKKKLVIDCKELFIGYSKNLNKKFLILYNKDEHNIIITNGKYMLEGTEQRLKNMIYYYDTEEVMKIKNKLEKYQKDINIIIEPAKYYRDYFNFPYERYAKLPVIKNWIERNNVNIDELKKLTYNMRVYYEFLSNMKNYSYHKIKDIQIYSVSSGSINISYTSDRFKELFKILEPDYYFNKTYNTKLNMIEETINSPHFSDYSFDSYKYLKFRNIVYYTNSKGNDIYVRIRNRLYINEDKYYSGNTEYNNYILDVNKDKTITIRLCKYKNKEIVLNYIPEQLLARIKLIMKKMRNISQIVYDSEIKLLQKILDKLDPKFYHHNCVE